MFSQGTKRLLQNYIRHTDTHNRIQEENEMWKQYEKSKNEEQKRYSSKKKSFLDDSRDDMNDTRYSMKSRSAHMDDKREETNSTYWTRQLEKIESADPDRWGHSGFRELYPQDFNSDRSESESSSSSSSSHHSHKRKMKRKKKKRKKEVELEWVESSSVKKDSKIREVKKKKCKKRKLERNISDDSTDSDNYVPTKRVKKHKNIDKEHKKNRKHKHKR